MIQTNDINMHFTQTGKGPLVLLLHGFPELGYSWRHQMEPIADAGYRVVAPDLRGYGQTDSPKDIDAYNMLQLTADVVGLVEALEETEAIIIGHDFGSALAQHCALLRPDIFKAVALLSVPYTPRKWGNMLPTQAMEKISGDNIYYINYFQEPDKIEKELELNVRESLMKMFHTNAEAGKQSPLFFKKSQTFLDNLPLPETLPGWLTEQDMDLFTQAFTQTGFTGPVNWYRNIDTNWLLTPFLTGAKILQPTLLIEGEYDAVRLIYRSAHKLMKSHVPNLKGIVTLPKTGHWIQQERPDEVNAALLEFLKQL